MDRRAKLLGLDMPFKQEVVVWTGDGDLDREIQELIAQVGNIDRSANALADQSGEAGTITT
jgi:hypothetical protein